MPMKVSDMRRRGSCMRSLLLGTAIQVGIDARCNESGGSLTLCGGVGYPLRGNLFCFVLADSDVTK